MEENETKVDETLEEETLEEETEAEDVNTKEEEENSEALSHEEIQKLKEENEELKKKVKTTQAQKEHFRKKMGANKQNTEQLGEAQITEISRLASKYSDEDLQLLKEIKEVKGLDTLTEATNSELFKATIAQRETEEKKAKAQMPASKGGSKYIKDEDTPENLKKAWLGK
jgi:hypothetical protein